MKRIILPVSSEPARERLCAVIHGLDIETPWAVEIKPYKPERSDSQNHALFGVAYPVIMEHCGLQGARDKEDLHEYWCGEMWGWVEYSLMGKRKQRPKRTTTTGEDGKRDVISTTEFSGLYEMIQRRMAEQGVFVPDPDPLLGGYK